MEERVRDFIAKNRLIHPGQTVGVAVSGGPDSMALLSCLHTLAPFFSCFLACIHFEHGIRGQESLRDADFVETFCRKRGIPFYMSAADVPALAQEWGMSIETAAKHARESYFETLVECREVSVIATGHQRDDQAESVLMHILRGSGLEGLKGIAVRNGVLIRPLLCVSRADVMAYVRANQIPYVEDKSNSDNAHTRNFVRNVLLPQVRERINPDVSGALNRLSEIAAEDASYLTKAAEREFDACARKQEDRIEIDCKRFLQLAPALAFRIIKLACAKLFVVQDIEKTHIDAVLRLVRSGKTGTRLSLMGGLCAEIEYDTLIICHAARRIDHSFCRMFDVNDRNGMPDGSYILCEKAECCDFANQDPYVAYVDLEKLPERILLRTRHAGDRIVPLGCGGSKKLKDYFIDRKLPREEREKTPLLADGQSIIWAVGHTISDVYKVDESTKHILRMQYIRGSENKEEYNGGND